MRSDRFTVTDPLASLKDFQKNTVEYVFQQLYAEPSNPRFLVADEVGLGKTMIAKGVIAKALQRLKDKDRVNVIYICSNAAIAKQNVKRLTQDKNNAHALETRLTLLPKQLHLIRQHKVNFISLTPGTAFDHTRSRGGHVEERAILYQILHGLPWAQLERRAELRAGLLNMLQATAGKDSWRTRANSSEFKKLDTNLSLAFRKEVLSKAELYSDLKKCCDSFKRYRGYEKIPVAESELRYRLIGELRSLLASVCLSELEPDLVILDEFQRFKHLLSDEDESAVLAKRLFEHPDVRILLLSATPYKMYTLNHESDEDDHYPDFIKTLEFLLLGNQDRVDAIKKLLASHRAALHGLTAELSYPSRKKEALERALLQVMCRTERVTTTRDHNAMLAEIEQVTTLMKSDLEHAALVDKISHSVNAGEWLEYWKSTPYLINFLKHYEFGKKLREHVNAPSEALQLALFNPKVHMLTQSEFDKGSALSAGNPKMQALFKDTLDRGMWQLLWMPPSMPYIVPEGVYAGKDALTKALIFSAWTAVPDAISSVCSYEAERKMIEGSGLSHANLYDKAKPLLRFSMTSAEGDKPNEAAKATGMPVILWMLPSPTLATLIDPLKIALAHGKKPLSHSVMVAKVKGIIRRELLPKLTKSKKEGRADERWYWAALILLEPVDGALLTWCKDIWAKEDADPNHKLPLALHIKQLNDVHSEKFQQELGPMPKDLLDVLCDVALAGPGVCALRALLRLGDDPAPLQAPLFSAAVKIASGFRTLFNLPETIAMLRGLGGDDVYWRRTLQYGVDGNLQAVLDEYVHVLKESLGLQDRELVDQASGIAKQIESVLSLRTAQIKIDEIKPAGDGFKIEGFNTRSRFALRFGEIKNENEQAVVRAGTVGDAFNSPFRPFVLASTSIGQEGLDFHTWCHAVMHWNLPSNPVDLEQREGRVNRYKGHAVRKNIAEKYGLKMLESEDFKGDPWQILFETAQNNKPEGQSDLVPYWIFEDGAARVERRIPILPYSKDIAKLKRLKQGLAFYRMAFGQPRQEDLVYALSQNENYQSADLTDWHICLEPPVMTKGKMNRKKNIQQK